jgi:hypothetical protein
MSGRCLISAAIKPDRDKIGRKHLAPKAITMPQSGFVYVNIGCAV